MHWCQVFQYISQLDIFFFLHGKQCRFLSCKKLTWKGEVIIPVSLVNSKVYFSPDFFCQAKCSAMYWWLHVLLRIQIHWLICTRIPHKPIGYIWKKHSYYEWEESPSKANESYIGRVAVALAPVIGPSPYPAKQTYLLLCHPCRSWRKERLHCRTSVESNNHLIITTQRNPWLFHFSIKLKLVCAIITAYTLKVSSTPYSWGLELIPVPLANTILCLIKEGHIQCSSFSHHLIAKPMGQKSYSFKDHN